MPIGGPPIPVKVPIKPEHAPAIAMFFLFAFKFHFKALRGIVINNKIPKIIKKLLVPIVSVIRGTERSVPITLPERAYNRSFTKISFKLRKALLNAKKVPIKTIDIGIIEGSVKIIIHPGIPKPIPTELCAVAPMNIAKSIIK